MSELVSSFAAPEEREAEASVRPRRLAEFIAQHRVREQLDLLLQGAVRRGRPPDHILLSGPPGLGKTTLAMIVAAELGVGLRITSGPAIERSGDLAAGLTSLSRGGGGDRRAAPGYPADRQPAAPAGARLRRGPRGRRGQRGCPPRRPPRLRR